MLKYNINIYSIVIKSKPEAHASINNFFYFLNPIIWSIKMYIIYSNY